MQGNQIPAMLYSFISSNELSIKEAGVLSAIIHVEKASLKRCILGNKKLAEIAGITPRWVQICVGRLLKKGFIFQQDDFLFEGHYMRSITTKWNSNIECGEGEWKTSPRGAKPCAGERTPVRPISYSSNKNTQSQVPPASSKKGETMPFINNEATPKKTKYTPNDQDIKIAKRLRSILTKHQIIHKTSINKWAIEITKLRQNNMVDYTRMKIALTWLKDNLRDRYTPVIHSATKFREKFFDLEAAMKRKQGSAPVNECTVSDRAKRNLNSLDYLNWPKGSGTQLPSVIQRSLDSLLEFMTRLKALSESVSNAKVSVSKRTATNILNWVMAQGVDNFVVMYFRRVHKNVVNWIGWNANLSNYIITPTTKLFAELCREEIQKRSGDASGWDRLVKEMGYTK